MISNNHIGNCSSNPIIVSVSGCYWSGSSAVVDILSEHSDCKIVKGEFALFSYGQFFHEALLPLISKVNVDEKKVAANIFRFLEFNRRDVWYPARPLLKRICSLLGIYPLALNSTRAGLGDSNGDRYQLACSRLVETVKSLTRKNSDDAQEVLFSMIHEIFLLLFNAENCDQERNLKACVFDQGISPAYASSALELYPNFKFIFVDRDWRDQYVEIKGIIHKMTRSHLRLGVRPMGETSHDYGISDSDYFINLRRRVNSLKVQHAARYENQILWINFEDLVLKRCEATKKIFEFLGLEKNHWSSNTFFFPEKSSRNIGKWRESLILKDIKEIGMKLDS